MDAESSILLDELLEIDLASAKCRSIKGAPVGRLEHALCVYRGHLFISGGRTQKKIFNDARAYSIAQDKYAS